MTGTIGKRIREAREARGWTQDELASAVGVSQPAIKKVESGQTKRSKFLPRIARALGLPLDELDPDMRTPHIVPNISYAKGIPDDGLPTFKVYAASQGGSGAAILSKEPVDYRPMPTHLAAVRDSYGVYVVGESMVPRFLPGEVVEVAPHAPWRRACDVILYRDKGDGQEETCVKHLVRWTDDKWFVCQHNPAQEIELDRAEWTKCHVIVGVQFK